MDRYKLAREFAQEVKGKYKGNIHSIVLFGSVAKGKEKKGSDIDLLVISKKRIYSGLKEPISKILKKGVVPEVLNLSVSEFNKMKERGSPLYFTIHEEGIKIA